MLHKISGTDLTKGPLLPKIVGFAVPLAISSILQLLFNAADVVVVGQFAGSEALAAVGSTTSLILLLVNMFVGFSVGSNVAAARAIGAGDNDYCTKVVHTSIIIAMLGGGIIMVVGLLFSPMLLKLMGSPDNVIELSTIYLRIYFLGMPASMLYNFGASLLRSKGDTRRPLYCLTISGSINVIFNLAFVIIFHMSVSGVALATIISQLVSAVMVMVLLLHEDAPIRVELKHMHMDIPALKEIVRIGFPAGLQGTLFSLSNVVVQSAVNSFGAVVIAGNSAAASIEGFIFVGMNSFHQACVTFTSQNIGAGKCRNVDKIMKYCICCVMITGAVMGGGAVLLERPLLGIYSSEPAVIEAGAQRLSIVGLGYFTCGIMDVLVGGLRGLGYSFTPMIVSLIGSCVLRLVWMATVFNWIGTTQVLYICYPITWIVTAVAQVGCFISLRRIAYAKYTSVIVNDNGRV